MRRLASFHFPVLALIVGSLGGCSAPVSETGSAAPVASEAMVGELQAALSVVTPRALAEALALYDRSLSGTRAGDFAAATFTHLPVVDLLGQPFEDLVFASEVEFHSDSAYASCEDGTLTVAVGATRAQLPVSWSRCGSDLKARIEALTAQIGADRVEALVGADASTYLLRTVEGAYWDVGDGSELTAEQVDELRQRYQQAWDEAEGSGTIELLRDAWLRFDAPLDDYTRDDGSLDLGLALPLIPDASILELIEGDGSPAGPMQVYSQWTANCTWFLFANICTDYEAGHHQKPYRTQAHYPNQFSNFSVPACAGGGTQSNVAGCGPAAFAGLTDWMWRQGQPFAGAGLSHGNEPHTGAWGWDTRPNQQSFYRQVETQVIPLMGACGLGSNGTLTLPSGFLTGGNAWLATHAPGVSLHASVGTFVANAFLGTTFASRLRARIGKDTGPALAGFHIDGGGAFSYHYSPVARYVVERPDLALTRTRIESIDGHASQLTNPWSLFSGVYWLEGNIGGCRFGDERFAWSCNGPIRGYDCTQILEPSDPYTWTDNYLCSGTSGFSWSYGWTSGSNCFRWSEPSDPHSWSDNFLCAP